MSELNKTVSDVNPEGSASGDSSASEDSSGTNDAAAKHIEKILREKKNAMKGLNELKAEVEQLRAEKQDREEAELIKKEEFQKVIELRNQEISKYKERVNDFEAREKEGKKTLSIMSELKKLGFQDTDRNKEIAMKLYNRSSVEVDPSTGLVLGADVAAKDFYDKYNSLGLFGQAKAGASHTAPAINSATINKPISEMTKEDLLEKIKGGRLK